MFLFPERTAAADHAHVEAHTVVAVHSLMVEAHSEVAHVAEAHSLTVAAFLTVVALTDMVERVDAARLKAPAPAPQHSSCAALRSSFYDNILPVWLC